MPGSSPGTCQRVTRLLENLQQGDDAVRDELFAQVYAQLHRQARIQRRRWNGEPSFQTTALVNEAYLKLVNGGHRNWSSRSHFFSVAAKAMRHILINHARGQRAEKRGGEAPKLSLEQLRSSLGRAVAAADQRAEVLLVLDEALERLEKVHRRASRVVECRCFVGMTIGETAEALAVSPATVSRDWALAKTWLYREMQRLMGNDVDKGGKRHER
jgi:RNA polymerase sigma factor (TIGR02999 family)